YPTVKVHGVFPSSCGYVASSRQLQFRRVARGDSGPVVTPFMQVGTYPTRNFAQVCYSRLVAEGPVISAGLCMSPCSSDCIFTSCGGAWRTVSEDSRNDKRFPNRRSVTSFQVFPADHLRPT